MRVKVKMNKNKKHLFAILFLLAFCLFRFQESVFRNEFSEFYSPDGYGSVGGFQMFMDQAKETPSIIFSDLYHNSKVGEGILEPGPFSFFWKAYLYVLSFVFDALDIIIFSVFIIALLNGLAFYTIIYQKTNRVALSTFGAVLAISFYNYHIRANGHLFGLGSIFLPIILFLFLTNLSHKNNYQYYILLGAVTFLNFNVNEYYGFYGFWVTLIPLLFVTIKEKIFDGAKFKTIIQHYFTAGISALILLLLFYPNIITAKIINKIQRADLTYVKGIAHPIENIIFYSVNNLKDLFTINRSFSLPQHIEFFKNVEFTYHIGLLISIFTALNLAYLYKKISSEEKKHIFISIFVAITSILLCLNPIKFPSLVELNAVVAPMFRVTYRSLLYFNISVVFLFLYSIHLIFKYSKTTYLRHIYITVAILAVSIDLPYPSLTKSVANQNFPAIDLIKVIAKDEQNFRVLNLPFYGANDPAPEKNYLYTYGYYFHKKEVLNFPFTEANHSKFINGINTFSKLVNEFSSEVPNILKSLGVKYIIHFRENAGNSTSNEKVNVTNLKSNKNLTLVDENEILSIYKINDFETQEHNSLIYTYLIDSDSYFDFSGTCKATDLKFYDCNHRSHVRFINYHNSNIAVSAKITFQIKEEELVSTLSFNLKPYEKFEARLSDLIKSEIKSKSFKVKISEVAIAKQ